ncbi:MAG: hypothetical protein E7166_02805 [Firmicutes bacterium]|nr:hypothetical protein [Bacillota bacterium]
MIKVLIEFVLFYVICYLLYLFFVVLKKKNNFKSKKPRIEESYLIGKYNIDFKKFKKKEYKKFLNIISLTNSFILSFTLVIVNIVKSMLFKTLLAFIILIPLILVSYMIIGKYYQKKGLIKDV